MVVCWVVTRYSRMVRRYSVAATRGLDGSLRTCEIVRAVVFAPVCRTGIVYVPCNE
ncbi:hypothetical protein FRUB_07490 [Fimbriiglobus ruber]|uniref:Uncharacterized protein n=1 Tax=Fimbriiglobus ruber TaxID=1908690 RepID=A0A225D9T2_9BACT|nr:hypothetical protein FRUB_07490 [Fimbriiglobus ruber]